jgi:starch synthase
MTKRTEKINVLFATAEAAPFAKVGGLGDVGGALPASLHANFADHIDIRTIMPFHAVVKAKNPPRKKIGDFSFLANTQHIECELFVSDIDGVPVYLIDNPFINHESPVYHGDWQLDGLKYASFSLALLEAMRYLDWKVDVLHANDWHTALAVHALATTYNNDPFFKGIKTVLSIHNLPYNGWGSQEAMNQLGFTPSDDPDLPDWAKFTPLPMGLASADKIIAVSPGYAREILTPEYGCGLEVYLQKHADKVMGILNGIDEDLWNPAEDKAISHHFSVSELSERVSNKLDLQEALDFKVNEQIPLITIVTRLSEQKGVPSILEALPQLIDRTWQFALLGSGSPELEEKARKLAEDYPDRVASFIKYDDVIARVLYASGDIFLMPSLYEPCGLSQMFAMRYGNLPLATATGGLADSIRDFSADPETATGFLYTEKTTAGLIESLNLALDTFEDQETWQLMQNNAMTTDFCWKTSAKKYLDVYKSL